MDKWEGAGGWAQVAPSLDPSCTWGQARPGLGGLPRVPESSRHPVSSVVGEETGTFPAGRRSRPATQTPCLRPRPHRDSVILSRVTYPRTLPPHSPQARILPLGAGWALPSIPA